jgi:hypothetical protein
MTNEDFMHMVASINGIIDTYLRDRTCEYHGYDCSRDAVGIAYGRNSGFGAYCEDHIEAAENETHPEYGTNCHLCGLNFGVN